MVHFDAMRILCGQGWLADQDREFQAAFLEKTVLKEVPAGNFVFRRGDFGGGMYGVAGGAFGVYVPWSHGEGRLADILRIGTWFGYGPALTRRARVLTFQAIERSFVLHVTLAALDQLTTANPRFARNLTKVSEFGMDVAIATISDLLRPDVEQRIGATLLRIAPSQARRSQQAVSISGLTQAQVGEMANAARDVVNRTLKHFEERGWIEVSYRKITIIKRSHLKAFVDN